MAIILRKSHDIKTKIHAVITYRTSRYSVYHICLKYHISKASPMRWNKVYDGTIESLMDKSRRPHTTHPNSHTTEEIKKIKNLVRRNPKIGLTEAKKHLDWLVSTEEMIAVELKRNHKVIGNIYLGNRDFKSLEIGFVFNKLYWNQGCAKESCSSIIKHSFKNGIHRIYAQCDPKNISFYNSSKFLHSTKIISSFICPKNDSIGALSQQFPRLDIDCSNPSLFYCFNE